MLITKKLLLFSLMTALMSSCYTTKITPISDIMDTWLGTSKNALIMQLGPPKSVTSDGNGGEVLIYENSHTITTNFHGLRLSNSHQLPDIYRTDNIVYYAQYYCDKDGKIYYWRTNYPDIEEKVENKKGTTAAIIVLSVLILGGLLLFAASP